MEIGVGVGQQPPQPPGAAASYDRRCISPSIYVLSFCCSEVVKGLNGLLDDAWEKFVLC